MDARHFITAFDLLTLIGRPDAPVLVDVCVSEDFDKDPHLIPGSIRLPHTDMPAITAHIGQRPAVIICQKGLKLSQGVAALLRANGQSARALEGGAIGWRQQTSGWRVRAGRLPSMQADRTKSVLPNSPYIDGCAIGWLLRRFVDTDAVLMFVMQDAMADVAVRFDATLFPPEEHEFSRVVKHFGLTNKALEDMAARLAADKALSALLTGLKQLHQNDNELLEASLPLFDALYQNCRLESDPVTASAA